MDDRERLGDHGRMPQDDHSLTANGRGPTGDRPEAEVSRPRRVSRRVTSALGEAADYVESAASAAVEAVDRRLEELPGARVRRIRRLARTPLPYLGDVHPDAVRRTRRDLGIRTIDVDDIAGTAVGGARLRGSDFLPLKPFRTTNWLGRWQRLGQAAERMTTLPPIDVLRYGPSYWVVDGHNRAAMAKYSGQAAIDADVTDLVDPGATAHDPAESFASLIEDSRELRAAVSRSTPSASSAPSPGPAPAPRPSPAAPTEPSGPSAPSKTGDRKPDPQEEP
jgi:hypothetical protein